MKFPKLVVFLGIVVGVMCQEEDKPTVDINGTSDTSIPSNVSTTQADTTIPAKLSTTVADTASSEKVSATHADTVSPEKLSSTHAGTTGPEKLSSTTLAGTASSENLSTTHANTVSHENLSSTHAGTTISEKLSSTTGDEINKTSTTTGVDISGDIILTSGTENATITFTSPAEDNNKTKNLTQTPLPSRTTEEKATSPASKWTACSLNPCRSGSTCLDDPSNPAVYSCACGVGFTGLRCSIVDKCHVSENGTICDAGACVYAEDRQSRHCKCFDRLYWDEVEKQCMDRDPPCYPNPCQNGGTCVDQDEDFSCKCQTGYDGKTCSIQNKCPSGDACVNGKCWTDKQKGLKYCECNHDFYWNDENKTCEAATPPCFPNPCKNSGHCKPLSSSAFSCSCTGYYSGNTCETRDFCISNEDAQDACDNGDCIVVNASRICHCNGGYYLDKETHVCKEIVKPCFPNPCANNGLCTPVSSHYYNCTCSEGYTGTQCTELDFCVLNAGNDYCNGSVCKNKHDVGVYYCACDSGQYFDYSGRTCRDVDLCPLMTCSSSETCVKSQCICKDHFKRSNITNQCEPNFCANDPCPGLGMECKEGEGIQDYECSCKEGYAFNGTHCKKASCIFPNFNSCDQICKETAAGYLCKCHDANFQLKEDNHTCEFIGNTSCSNKTCDMGACTVTDELEICICPPGYHEVDGKCVDLCTIGRLPANYCPGGKCVSTNTGFRCKCDGKYTLSQDKATCTVRKVCDKTEFGYSICKALNAVCVEDWSRADGYRCECRKGQNQTEYGVCQDICAVEENRKICSLMGATCDVSSSGRMICRCPPYFVVGGNGKGCTQPAEFSYLVILPLDKDTYQKKQQSMERRKRSLQTETVDYSRIRSDVTKAIGDLFAEFYQANVITCIEMTDYIQCKIELQFFEISAQELKRLKVSDICQTNPNSTSGACLLAPSLVLRQDKIDTIVTFQRTDPCDSDMRENLCGSETTCHSSADKKTFNCSCSSGFEARNTIYPFGDTGSFIENCKDIDECIENNPCQAKAVCQNTIGSYTCSCITGYRMTDSVDAQTDTCVETCNPNPCLHGHCTESGAHTFDCRCDAGYRGALCNLQDENWRAARANTAIVGGVLGGVLLLTIVIFIATYFRLKKKKFMDEPDHMLYNAAEMTERRRVDIGAINNAYQRD